MGEIRKEAELYHMNLFNEEVPLRHLLDGMEFDRISEVEKRWVERSFSEEVYSSIMSRKGDKSPGPDGFTISFF